MTSLDNTNENKPFKTQLFSPSASVIWDHKFKLCLDWQNENPKQILPRRLIIQRIKVGYWFDHQKFRYKASLEPKHKNNQGDLTPNELEKLRKIYSWVVFEEKYISTLLSS